MECLNKSREQIIKDKINTDDFSVDCKDHTNTFNWNEQKLHRQKKKTKIKKKGIFENSALLWNNNDGGYSYIHI